MAEDQYVLNWEVCNHSILYSNIPVHNRILPYKYTPQTFGDMFHVWSFWFYDSTTNPSIGKNHNLLFECEHILTIKLFCKFQERIWHPLPLVLFGGTAIISGILSLHFPETLNTVLPDTISEAENIGRPKRKKFIKVIQVDS